VAKRAWSWKLARIFGIDVYVHATFALLLAWVAFGQVAAGVGAMVRGLALILTVFGIVVLHELGHALVARRFGIRTRDIVLLPIGGVASLERLPEKPREQLFVAVAGPAVNVMLALLLWVVLAVTGARANPSAIGSATGSFLSELLWINVSLAAFNLLPAFPMDGGRVVRAALAFKLEPVRATEIAARLGQGMAVLLAAFGLFFNPMLLLIALFVWTGAQQELATAELKRALVGVPMASVMLTQLRVLSASDPLTSAAELVRTGFQQDFPVLDGTELVGVLTQADIEKSLAERGPSATVASAMQRGLVTADPGDALESVFERLQLPHAVPVVVMRGHFVLGLVTANASRDFVRRRLAQKTRGEPFAKDSPPW
jgi:Zn-dependent protease/predicted transcriptional regulator